MTDPNHVCPLGLNFKTYPTRACGRSNSSKLSCSSTTFSVGDSQYSWVCGRALAYRWRYNFAFFGHHRYGQGIDGQYVDGLSLMYGAPGLHQHIWTFASGLFSGNCHSVQQGVYVHVIKKQHLPLTTICGQ